MHNCGVRLCPRFPLLNTVPGGDGGRGCVGQILTGLDTVA